MSATIINLIIQLIAGAIGGNAAGAAKDISLGALGNTIAGAVGGVCGDQLLTAPIPMMAGEATMWTLVRSPARRSAVASLVRSSRPSSA